MINVGTLVTVDLNKARQFRKSHLLQHTGVGMITKMPMIWKRNFQGIFFIQPAFPSALCRVPGCGLNDDLFEVLPGHIPNAGPALRHQKAVTRGKRFRVPPI